jgi:hypothetical protein
MSFVPGQNYPRNAAKDRHCDHCDRTIRHAEPDPCLGYIPGVKTACCGHRAEGTVVERPGHAWVMVVDAFVYFDDGRHFDGDEALGYFSSLGVGPP